MECLDRLIGFINSPPIAAFLGALFAFGAVVLTDRRRRELKKKLLKSLISANHALALKKRESVRSNLALVEGQGRVSDAPIMPFYTPAIRELQIKALDRLNKAEIQALDALVYWMNAIDDLLSESTSLARDLKSLGKPGTPTSAPTAETDSLISEYISSLDDADRNLGHFIELSDYYLKDECHKILGFEHSQQ